MICSIQRFFIVLLVSQFAHFPSLASAATAYKWVDKQGNIHFSQHPPVDHPSERVIVPDKPPTGAAKANEAAKELLEKAKLGHEAYEKAQQEKKEQEKLAKAYEENCQIAKNNLKALSNSKPPHELKKGDQTITLTQEALDQEISATQKDIDKYCKPPQ